MAAGGAASALPAPGGPPPEHGVLRQLGFDGCVRLPLTVDTTALTRELEGLPGDFWTQADRDPVVQASVESFFAIGHPRGPRPLAPEDRPPLAHLPRLRWLLRETIPATPTRAIVARTCPHGLIPIHTDTPRFFRATLRLSIQVVAAGRQQLYCGGLWYDMAPGEVWAIDNLQPHGIENAADSPRINVLADYVPSDALAATIAAGEAGLGVRDDAATRAIQAATRERYRRNRWRSARYELFKLLWRRRA
jgi:Aspartyl/Asparaginyl beta-hydroxylase